MIILTIGGPYFHKGHNGELTVSRKLNVHSFHDFNWSIASVSSLNLFKNTIKLPAIRSSSAIHKRTFPWSLLHTCMLVP